jgi:hypothetical protein
MRGTSDSTQSLALTTVEGRGMSRVRAERQKRPGRSKHFKSLANSQACGTPYKIPTAREMSNTTMLSEMKI